MTAPLIEVLDLSAFKFEIPCHSPGCTESADFLAIGCSDKNPHNLCHFHMAAVKRRFDDNHGKVCETCHRPWLHFETHYSVMSIG